MRPTEGSIHTTDRDRGAPNADASSETDSQTTPQMTTTRRAILASLSAGVVGLAGCASAESVACPSPETETPVESMPPMAVAGSTPTVAVHAWEDLSCPHCATFATEVVPRLREEYVSDGVVRFVRHDFPIPVAEWAWPAASAVRSAQHHGGPEAALRYAETIYEHQREYDRRVLATAAREADVDPCTTIEAAIGETYRPVVEADRQRGRDRGVEGTPAVFVEGEPVVFGDEIGYAPVRAAVERHS